MKKYTLKFSVALIEGNDDAYSPPKPINFEVREKLPDNVDAQQYIKRRLAEEVKRNFDSLSEVIDNKTDEAKAEEDPLSL